MSTESEPFVILVSDEVGDRSEWRSDGWANYFGNGWAPSDPNCFRTSKFIKGRRYDIGRTPERPAVEVANSSRRASWLCVADFTGPDYVEPVTTKRLRTDEEMEAMLASAQTKKPDPDALPRLTSRLRGIAWRLEGIMQDPKLDEESMMLAKKALALTLDALKEASENDQ